MNTGEPARGPVIWITGASSGIGAALARQFAATGARVILSSRRRDALDLVADSCVGTSERPMVLPLDMTRPESFKPAVRQVIARFGRIDMLVNNAGVSQRALVAETSEAVEREIMEVDYFGAILLTKAVLPGMIEFGAGRIVVISSVMGYIGTPRRAAYAAAKHALHGWFDSLREEVRAAGIRVLLVCPGYVRTNVSLNALSGNGTPHGEMDPGTERGIPAEACASAVLQAINDGREEILVGGKEIWAVRAKRWFPRLFSFILRKVVSRGGRL